MRSAGYCTVLCVLLTAVCACAQVTVVATFPANGATGVDPSTTLFRVRFSEAMDTGGCSMVNTQYGEPLKFTGRPTFSNGDTICTVPVTLKPGVKYAVSINSDRFQNFRSARGGVPVTPYLVVFTTASGASGSAAVPAAASRQVTVVSTYPQNNDTKVDPKLAAIRVRFSEAVSPLNYSFVDTDQGAPLPLVGKPSFDERHTLCTYAVQLEPGTTYAVSINSDRYNSLRSEIGGIPVTPYLLKFTTSGEPPKAKTEAEKWQQDLAYLATELPKKHKNLFAKVTEGEWKSKVQNLNDRIPSMSEPEILVGLTALVASVRDQHTSIGTLDSTQLTTLPLSVSWFKDGIFVVAASDTYKNALGCQVTKIGDTDIDKACDAVSTLFAHDNQSAIKQTAPIFLTSPDFLKSAAVISKTDEVTLTLKDKDGRPVTATVRSVKNGSDHGLASVLDGSSAPVPIYRKNRSRPYWAEYVDKDNLVYFAYNQCADSPDHPLKQMLAEVDKLLDDHKDARLVIDLRSNGGGNSSLLDPYISALKGNTELNRKGRLFVVTGRRTFSSAILNAASLRTETNAVLVGEPTGASPNHYGEMRSFNLPNSRLNVCYSTKYFAYSDKNADAIVPDIAAEPTFAEFVGGVDPVMEAILNYPKQ